MKIVSGMQGTRNQEISSENKDENKPPKEKTYPQKKDKKDWERKQRKETKSKESIIAPVKHLGIWFKK